MNNEPVAWAMFKGDTFMDAIHPDEHARFEGGYNIPLYTHPVKELTQSEFENIFDACYIGDDYNTQYDFKQMLELINQAILRKAQYK